MSPNLVYSELTGQLWQATRLMRIMRVNQSKTKTKEEAKMAKTAIMKELIILWVFHSNLLDNMKLMMRGAYCEASRHHLTVMFHAVILCAFIYLFCILSKVAKALHLV